MISLSDFEWDQNQLRNLDSLESELSMIGFGSPNHLSLHQMDANLQIRLTSFMNSPFYQKN